MYVLDLREMSISYKLLLLQSACILFDTAPKQTITSSGRIAMCSETHPFPYGEKVDAYDRRISAL